MQSLSAVELRRILAHLDSEAQFYLDYVQADMNCSRLRVFVLLPR